jgi:DNA invertase Pin-like site-specific DNA recombinase
VREYVDVGESGAKDSRPQLNELMAAASKRQFDAGMVWHFDRFARSKIRPRYEWVRRRKTFTAHKKDFAAVSAC